MTATAQLRLVAPRVHVGRLHRVPVDALARFVENQRRAQKREAADLLSAKYSGRGSFGRVIAPAEGRVAEWCLGVGEPLLVSSLKMGVTSPSQGPRWM